MAKKRKSEETLTLDEAISQRSQRRPALLKIVCDAAEAHAAGEPYDGEKVRAALEEIGESKSFFEDEVDLYTRRAGFEDLREKLAWLDREWKRRGRIWRKVLFRAKAMHDLVDRRVTKLRNRTMEALVTRNKLLEKANELDRGLLTAYERELIAAAKRDLDVATAQHRRLSDKARDLLNYTELTRWSANFLESLDRDTPASITTLVLPSTIFKRIPTGVQLPENSNALNREQVADYIGKLRDAGDRYEAAAKKLEPRVKAALTDVERCQQALEHQQAAVPQFKVETQESADPVLKRVFKGSVMDKATAILVNLAEETDGEANPAGSLLEVEQVLEDVFAELQAPTAEPSEPQEPETGGPDPESDAEDGDGSETDESGDTGESDEPSATDPPAVGTSVLYAPES